MGGHLHGELAASLTIETFVESFGRHAQPRIAQPNEFIQRHHAPCPRAHHEDSARRRPGRFSRNDLCRCADTGWQDVLGPRRRLAPVLAARRRGIRQDERSLGGAAVGRIREALRRTGACSSAAQPYHQLSGRYRGHILYGSRRTSRVAVRRCLVARQRWFVGAVHRSGAGRIIFLASRRRCTGWPGRARIGA